MKYEDSHLKFRLIFNLGNEFSKRGRLKHENVTSCYVELFLKGPRLSFYGGGQSFWNPIDKFDAEQGRKIALGRALEVLSSDLESFSQNSKKIRAKIWHEYLLPKSATLVVNKKDLLVLNLGLLGLLDTLRLVQKQSPHIGGWLDLVEKTLDKMKQAGETLGVFDKN